jgi:hypothetical protein
MVALSVLLDLVIDRRAIRITNKRENEKSGRKRKEAETMKAKEARRKRKETETMKAKEARKRRRERNGTEATRVRGRMRLEASGERNLKQEKNAKRRKREKPLS